MADPPLPPAEELEAGNPESLRKQAQCNPGLVRAKLCSPSEYLHSLPGEGREREQREEKDRKIHTGRRKQRERGRKRARERRHTQHSGTGWRRAKGKEVGRDREADREVTKRPTETETWGEGGTVSCGERRQAEPKGTESRANPDTTLSQVPTSTACFFEANFIKE